MQSPCAPTTSLTDNSGRDAADGSGLIEVATATQEANRSRNFPAEPLPVSVPHINCSRLELADFELITFLVNKVSDSDTVNPHDNKYNCTKYRLLKDLEDVTYNSLSRKCVGETQTIFRVRQIMVCHFEYIFF